MNTLDAFDKPAVMRGKRLLLRAVRCSQSICERNRLIKGCTTSFAAIEASLHKASRHIFEEIPS